MKHVMAATLAAVIALSPLANAAAADAPPAAEPFPAVPLPPRESRPTGASWLAFGAGAGVLTGSFLIHERANRSYSEYLGSTDPAELEELYDRTVMLDRVSGAALIAGQVLLATGVYLRFLRTPAGPARVALAIEPH